MCGQLPEEHDRCQTAASEAALALAVHVAERRLGAASDRPAEPRAFDYTKGIPQQADLSLIVAVRERVSGKRGGTESATTASCRTIPIPRTRTTDTASTRWRTRLVGYSGR